METKYEIIVEVNGEIRYLDTYKYEPISLTFNVADIQDISKRNSSFSRTITLPETDNNRDVFNNISDLASDSTFNPNLKSKAYILVDTISIFEGYIQLKNIILSDTLENKLEAVIFADNDTFFTRIGDNYIEDLDYSDLNHIYSTQSVIDSWTSGQELGYFYPLIDYGQGWTIDMINGISGSFSSATNSYVNLNEIFPATYVKTIWDKIFNENEYFYQSNFLNSQKFKDLLIPFNGFEFNNGPTFPDDKRGYLGISPTFSVSNAIQEKLNFIVDSGYSDIYPLQLFGNPNNYWTPDGVFIQNNDIFYSQNFTVNFESIFNINYNNNVIIFLKLRVYREFIPNGNTYLTTSFDPNIVNTGQIVQDTTFIITDGGPQTSGVRTFIGDNPLNQLGSFDTTHQISINIGTSSVKLDGQFNTRFFSNDSQFNVLKSLYQNERVRVDVVPFWLGESFGSFSILKGEIFNSINNNYVSGSSIIYKNSIPKKIKQKDFITSIIKMFNLIIEPSKEFNNTLIIEPRDDYYSSGVIKDWTDKIDLNVDISSQILADTQNKEVLFSYKDDKDRLNTLYKSTYNEIYGQYLYPSQNEFATGVKKIDVIFSSTPLALVPGSNNFPIPRIVKDDLNYNQLPGGRIDPNIRIVTRYNTGDDNGLLPFNNTFDKFGFEGLTLNSYPYVGHYDNPYTPTDDINFGQLKEQFFPSTIVTDDNLVNNYWINFLNETVDKDSRIITVEMFLTPTDINNFRFNDSIYLLFNNSGHYYKVNKISNYDPGIEKTCSVELIKSINRPLIRTRRNITNRRPNVILGSLSTNVINLRQGNQVVSAGSITTGVNNILRGNSIFINGDNNDIITRSGIINGNNNIVGQETKFIYLNGEYNNISNKTYNISINGNNNLISSSSSNLSVNGNNNILGTSSVNLQVFGNNNLIQGITNSFIIGDNINATQSNTTYIGNNLVISGSVSIPNLGLQQVLNNGSTGTSSVLVNSNNGTYSLGILNTGISLRSRRGSVQYNALSTSFDTTNTGVILPVVDMNGVRHYGKSDVSSIIIGPNIVTTTNPICVLKVFTNTSYTSNINIINWFATMQNITDSTTAYYEGKSVYFWDGTTATVVDIQVNGFGNALGVLTTTVTGNSVYLTIDTTGYPTDTTQWFYGMSVVY